MFILGNVKTNNLLLLKNKETSSNIFIVSSYIGNNGFINRVINDKGKTIILTYGIKNKL